MNIFRYIVPIDDGAAPNPYGGVCTLAICKPNIRRIAKVGDWLVGLNSSKEMIYCMKVTSIMNMKKYDKYTQEKLPIKVPDITNKDIKKHMGDSVYEFKDQEVLLRKSVHSRCTKQLDLEGKNVLLSEHFFYFGNKSLKIPTKFTNNIDTTIDFDCFEENLKLDFINYIKQLKLKQNQIFSNPSREGIILPSNKEEKMSCCTRKEFERQFI